MVDFQSLTDARPELLDTVAETFDRWSDFLDQQAVEFRNKIIDEITQPTVWQGDAADAAGRHCRNVRLAVFKSVDELREIVPILTEVAGGIAAAKESLRSAVTQARELGLTVAADGAITGPHDQAKELAQRIRDAIKTATDADQKAADALSKHTPDVRDVAKVADRMRDLKAKGKRAAELAGRAWLLSENERAELLKLLKANSHDPTFAAAMLHDLGPRGTLSFGGSLAYLGAGDGNDEQIKQLQRALGHVLATGTNPRMEPHVPASWTTELTKAGREKFDIGLTNYQPYGYQLLGAMMHSGTYSAEFLNAVGNDLLRFEQQHPGVWAENSDPRNDGFKLNHIDKRGLGYDPMSGLMRAMAHNPEAAKQFFDPRKHPDTLDYLINRPVLESPYSNDFGHALEAATLHGDRDARATAIAAEAINDLGTRHHGKLPPMPDNLKDSVGRIIAGHIGDVNEALASPVRSTGFESRALLTTMGEAAKDPGAYGTMYDAERAYSARMFDHAGSFSNVLDRQSQFDMYAKQSAQVFGALDYAQGEAILQRYADADKAYNEAVEHRGAAASAGLGWLVKHIPVVGDDIGKVTDIYADTLTENSKHDTSGVAIEKAGKLFDDGRAQATARVIDSMWQHKMWPPEHPPPAILLHGGEPVPLAQMSERQQEEFGNWMMKDPGYSRYMAPVADSINQSYSEGTDRIVEQVHGR